MEDAEQNLESRGRVLKQSGPLWEEGGSGSRIFGNQGLHEGRTENTKAQASPSEENKANKSNLPKVRKGLPGQRVGCCHPVAVVGTWSSFISSDCRKYGEYIQV